MVTRIKPRWAAKSREEFNAGFRIKMYSEKKGDDGWEGKVFHKCITAQTNKSPMWEQLLNI